MQRRLGLDLEVPDDFGHWMAGFTDGEGTFGARIHPRTKSDYLKLDVRFAIGLREDDRPILEKIRDTLGVGTVFPKEGTDRQRRADYIVNRTADLYHIIVPLFERYPLRAKKRKDFETWKRIVDIKYHSGGKRFRGFGCGTLPLPQSYWDKIKPLIRELKEGRKFRP